ncbi:phosphoenolpyruvate--protein phosphotransferase [Oscillospiraceae bacterium PP1C4]
MEVLHGESVCGGVVFGRIKFYHREQSTIARRRIKDTEAEVERFEQARKQAISQLSDLYAKATAEVGEENSLLFQVHQMMLEDIDYCASVTRIIRDETLNAEYAVNVTSDHFAKTFSDMDDEYMKSRAADVHDISKRVLRILMGGKADGLTLDEPVIVAANDLMPSETVQLDKSKVLAIATSGGSANSHTAIFARGMGIPAVIGIGMNLSEELDDTLAIVDGSSGNIYLNPDAKTSQKLLEKQKMESEHTALLKKYNGKPTITQDGKQICLNANIGNLEDMDAVIQNDAEGIGLFRSEFLYLKGTNYPTEEEQFEVYKSVAEKMEGKRVIFRTLDIGADKQVDYFQLPKEENPAMGFRAIRICLTRPEVFKTQLHALYRASAYGKIAIMFPMITSVGEIKKIKEIVSQVQEELEEKGVPFASDVELGIMIETPAAALISDQLAKEVDFFSVGTNDLTQYTLAIDRQNSNLAPFLDAHHPAILRLIQIAAENAHKNGIWIGICGELGADTSLTELFLAMNIDELSVSPSRILSLRAKIHGINVKKIKDAALSVL